MYEHRLVIREHLVFAQTDSPEIHAGPASLYHEHAPICS